MDKSYQLKLVSTGYHNIKFVIFLLYNMAYVFYMLGMLNRILYLGLLMLFLAICIFEYIVKNEGVFGKKKDYFWHEFLRAMFIVLVFFCISVCIQLYHGGIKGFLFSELLYNVIPPAVAFFWINTSYKEERYTYFFVFLLRNVLYFVIANIGNFSLSNILAISWGDSKSSIFETPYAHDFFFLEIIFFYFNKKKLAMLCMILCMLNFKRISFILSLCVFGFCLLLEHDKKIRLYFEKKRNVRSQIRYMLLIVLCIMPFVISFAVSDAGLRFFDNVLGINLDEFTTGRVGVIRYTIKNIGFFNGYGSSDSFLKNSINPTYQVLGSMHCDILRIYLETTMIGVIVYFKEMMEIAKKSWIIFGMLMYLFMELIFSHFINALGVWIMFFMFAAMIYAEKKECMKVA